MMRALFWIALIVLVVFAIRSKLRAAATRAASHEAAARRSTTREPAEIESVPMACCEFCGVYFPASEAVRAEGRDYCSPAHARHTSP
jgi:uncharacterized protein